jgi:hypothetical protein
LHRRPLGKWQRRGQTETPRVWVTNEPAMQSPFGPALSHFHNTDSRVDCNPRHRRNEPLSNRPDRELFDRRCEEVITKRIVPTVKAYRHTQGTLTVSWPKRVAVQCFCQSYGVRLARRPATTPGFGDVIKTTKCWWGHRSRCAKCDNHTQ